MTQTQQILEAMQSGESLTPLDALNRYGCLRLGARIWELKREGHNIMVEMVETPTGKRVARYWMVQTGGLK